MDKLDVSRAEAIALCNGNIVSAPLNSTGNLSNSELTFNHTEMVAISEDARVYVRVWMNSEVRMKDSFNLEIHELRLAAD